MIFTELDRFKSSVLFRENFFKFVSWSDSTATAQCMLCKKNGQTKFRRGKKSSNYTYHLKVKF